MSDSVTDRNLLIGILAVQLDFISQDQLIESMMAWVVDKSISIDEIFLRKEFIDPTTRELIQALVAKHIENHGGTAEQSLAAVSSLGKSVRGKLQSLDDSSIEASLLGVASKPDEDEVSSFGVDSTLQFSGGKSESRYRILRPHASGGLGEVHVAFDSELNREVALKEIQDDHADHPDSRARFITEAEVTGGLEHPGIVPVYGLGNYSNGRPFYAMRFIKGDSLKEAINYFHQNELPGKRNAFQSLEFRKLLGRFVDVCNAIEYAHSRGVLHRDLKPGNIMLGKYGETLVVDWGLSKVVGRGEIPVNAEEATLQLSSNSGSAPTQLGTALGTPQFMPPEQASGRLDQLGPHSDVYSMGATLYYLLTGQAPFKKKDLGELINDVQRGRFPEPRDVNFNIPKPLEAVCLKAMANRGDDRFSSMLELGEEIERWLSDEPVSCMVEPMGARIWRFAKRNRLAIAATSVLLLSISVGLIIFSGLLAVTNKKLTEKNREIESQSSEIAVINSELNSANLSLKQTNEDLKNVSKQSEDRRILAETRFAEMLLEKGRGICERGDPAVGIQWIAKSLIAAPVQASDLQQAIRLTLNQWRKKVLMVQGAMTHKSNVTVTEFSGNGKLFLTASFDRTARVWSAINGQPVGPVLKLTHQAEAAVFLKDNQTVVVGCYDGKVYIFNGIDGEKKGELDTKGLVRSIVVSDDESVALARTNSGTLHLFDPKNGSAIEPPSPITGSFSAADLHPSGVTLIAADYKKKSAQVYVIQTGMPEGEPILFSKSARVLRYSPAGNRIVMVSDRFQIYNTEDLTPVGSPLPQNGVHKIDFSEDGSRFVTAGIDGQSIVFRTSDGKRVGLPLRHSNQVSDAKISPDGLLALTSSSRIARLWDIRTGRPIGQPVRDSGEVAFGPDGLRIATGSYDSSARIWAFQNEEAPEQRLDLDGFIRSAKFNAKHSLLVAGGQGESVRIWKFDPKNPFEIPIPRSIEAESTVGAIDIHPSGESIAIGYWNNEIHIHDSAGKPLRKLLQHEGAIQSLQFSKDGKILVSAGDDSNIIRWNPTTGKPIGETLLAKGPVRSMAVVSSQETDFPMIVAGGWTNKALVWNAVTGELLRTLDHNEKISSLQVSSPPSGKLILTSDNKGEIRAWNPISGPSIWTNKDSKRGHNVISFSSDEKKVLIAGYDGLASVLDASSGKRIAPIVRHETSISAGCFALNDQVILTGDQNGFVRLSHAVLGYPIAMAEKHLGEISVVLPFKNNQIIAGHSSLRMMRISESNDTKDQIIERLEYLTSLRLDESGDVVILDSEALKERSSKLATSTRGNAGDFKLQPLQLDQRKTISDQTLHINPLLSAADQTEFEKGPFGRINKSASIPKRD